MSSGLVQRRRGPAAGNEGMRSDDYSDERYSDFNNSNQQDSLGSPNGNSSSTRVNDFNDSDKPGYFDFKADEEGFTDQDVEGKKVKLTLMEEILLLALRDQQGIYSFWNESLSYVLRGCMIIELAMRNKIAIFKEPAGRHNRKPFSDRLIDVVDDKPTGEALLDEALKIMKMEQATEVNGQPQRHSIADWMDLLSGETWNMLKFSYQMKQVRERLSKGLVDKGVLRTEKKNFVVFEMTTHPVTDQTVKNEIITRILNFLLGRGQSPTRRTIALVASAYAANVLDNVLAASSNVGVNLSFSQKDSCFAKCEDLILEWSGSSKSGNGGEVTSQLSKDMNDKARIGWTDVMYGVLAVYVKMESVL